MKICPCRTFGMFAGMLAAAGAAAVPVETAVVYESRYEDKMNLAHWSKGTVADGGRMLGPHGVETNVLTLDGLPMHAFVRLEAELVLVGSWDGNFRSASQVTIALSDRRVLMASSFASNSILHLTPSQSFPDNIDGGTFQEAYGVVARNVDWAPRPQMNGNQGNGVVALDFTFPHATDAMRLEISASRLRGGTWGLGKVRVSTLAKSPVKLDLGEAQRLVADLDSVEPARIERATWRLIKAGDDAVPLIRSVLVGHVEANDNLGGLIRELDHEVYTRREAAQKALIRAGIPALAASRKAMREAPTAEKRARLDAIINELSKRKSGPLDLRLQRVLTTIGSRDAIETADGYLSYPPLPELATIRVMLRQENEERWKELQAVVSRVLEILKDPGIQGMMSRERQLRNLRPEMQLLNDQCSSDETTDAELAAALAAARKAYLMDGAAEEPALQPLRIVRKELQRRLTIRQEAVAVTLGLLD